MFFEFSSILLIIISFLFIFILLLTISFSSKSFFSSILSILKLSKYEIFEEKSAIL